MPPLLDATSAVPGAVTAVEYTGDANTLAPTTAAVVVNAASSGLTPLTSDTLSSRIRSVPTAAATQSSPGALADAPVSAAAVTAREWTDGSAMVSSRVGAATAKKTCGSVAAPLAVMTVVEDEYLCVLAVVVIR